MTSQTGKLFSLSFLVHAHTHKGEKKNCHEILNIGFNSVEVQEVYVLLPCHLY